MLLEPERQDRKLNRLTYWFPAVQDSLQPQEYPETKILWTDCNLLSLIYGIVPNCMKQFRAQLSSACLSVGLPCFLRTDELSGKHSWSETCYVEHVSNLPRHIARLVEESELADIMGLPIDVWVVRKMLRAWRDGLSFRAFNGMPMTSERRLFVRNGELICHHPYWPPASIKNPDCCDWESKLEKLNTCSTNELSLLQEKTKHLSRHPLLSKHAWSVDWLYCPPPDDSWYLIDMALAEMSWHWPDCGDWATYQNQAGAEA